MKQKRNSHLARVFRPPTPLALCAYRPKAVQSKKCSLLLSHPESVAHCGAQLSLWSATFRCPRFTHKPEHILMSFWCVSAWNVFCAKGVCTGGSRLHVIRIWTIQIPRQFKVIQKLHSYLHNAKKLAWFDVCWIQKNFCSVCLFRIKRDPPVYPHARSAQRAGLATKNYIVFTSSKRYLVGPIYGVWSSSMSMPHQSCNVIKTQKTTVWANPELCLECDPCCSLLDRIWIWIWLASASSFPLMWHAVLTGLIRWQMFGFPAENARNGECGLETWKVTQWLT